MTSIRETTLSANQWIEKAQRLQFTAETMRINKNNSKFEDLLKSKTVAHDEEMSKIDSKPQNFEITLEPMEIRTFVVEMKWKA